MSIVVTVRFQESVNERVQAWATQNGVTISTAVRMLIEDKLNDLARESPAEETWRRSALQEARIAEAEKMEKRFRAVIKKITEGE